MQDSLHVDSTEPAFDLYSTQIDADPFPFYAKLRARPRGITRATLVTAVAMRAFLEVIPHYERAQSRLDWVPSSNFRSPVSLPFRVG